MEKMRKAGYSENFIPIEEGILKYVQWLKSH
jgi:hypothetical protein